MNQHDHLTIGEWDRFRDDDLEFKSRVLKSLDALTQDSAERNTEIALLKAGSSKTMHKMTGLSAITSAIVSGIVAAFKS